MTCVSEATMRGDRLGVEDREPYSFRNTGPHRSVGPDFGGIEDQLLAPDEARCDTLLNDRREEAAEDRQPEACTDFAQTRVIGQWFVKVIAEIPPHRETEPGDLDQLAFGADALKEHHEMQLEEDDGIDRRTAPAGVAIRDEITDEKEVEGTLEVAVEMIVWNR